MIKILKINYDKEQIKGFMYYNANGRKIIQINDDPKETDDVFVQEVGHSFPKSGTKHNLPPRTVYTIHFVVSGVLCFDDNELHMGEGYLIPSDTGFSISVGEDCEHYWMMVGGTKVSELFAGIGKPDSSHLLDTGFFKHIRKDFDFTLSYDQTIGFDIPLLMMSLLWKLLSVVHIDERTDVFSQSEYVRIGCEYIEQHYFEQISVEEIAAAAHVSSKYMYKLFKKELGVSPKELLIAKRISYGKYLLETTQMTVEDIAVSVGYSCASRFIYAFRKSFGVSPNVARATHMKSKANHIKN